MKATFEKHLENAICAVPGKGKAKTDSEPKPINDEIDESTGTLIRRNDDHHHKNVEVMVPLYGQVLPSFRIDGPYGTASRY